MAASTVAGCSAPAEIDATGGALLVLALLVVAGGFFGFGQWRERARAHRLLQAARAEALRWSGLLPHSRWRSDAGHRLVQWVTVPEAPTAEPPDAGVLASALAAERPIRGLRVPAAGAAARHWIVDADPLHDADGRFLGFVGAARPCAREDEAARHAALVTPLLAAAGDVGLVAVERDGRWQVEHFNAAARSLWPDLDSGQPLEPLLAALPAAATAVLAGLTAGQAAEIDPWRLQRIGPLPGGDALLLSRLATPPAAPDHEAFGPTLSHDLRAPIRVVEGFTRIVKEDYGRLLDRVGNEHLDRVLGAAARMNLMIDALLALARLSSQPLSRQPVNLSQLAHYVIDDLRRGAPERGVEVEIEPGLAARGDPTLLRMVLENLLGNAWKYTARVPRARIVLRRAERDGRHAFEIADNGAGFDMRSADRLFGLFQRLHSQSDFPGHGVGLASVRRIVRRHGGEVWAQAEPGRGATFGFTLE